MTVPARETAIEIAVREELALAAALLRNQQEVWDALCRAEPGVALGPRLRRQEEALEALRRASTQRAALLAPIGGFDAWLATLAPPRRESLLALRSQGRRLRGEIETLAARSNWLARRSAHWLETQRALVAELAAERLGPGTYGQGARSTAGQSPVAPSLLDRSA